MTFERPDLLGWIPVAVVLLTAGIGWQWRRSARLAEAFGGAAAARRLTGRRLDRFPSARLTCVLLAALAAVLAAAGAGPDADEPPPPAAPVDLIVLLDVSHSMTASDVAPSRAARAKQAVERIVEERLAERIALTLFAGWPYGLVPVTDDEALVDFFLPPVSPEAVEQRDQGTSLAAAVGHARATWRARARPEAIPVLLIVSDGESHGAGPAVLDSIEALVRDGLRVWTAGVGTEGGAPLFVPRSSGAPLLEGSGGQVVAGYDPELLREMAQRGGGGFHDIADERAISALVSDLRDLGGAPAPEEAATFDPTVLLLLAALALLSADALLDAGGRRRRSAGAARGETGE